MFYINSKYTFRGTYNVGKTLLIFSINRTQNIIYYSKMYNMSTNFYVKKLKKYTIKKWEKYYICKIHL